MTCDEVRSALEAFIKGELPEREGAEVIDHLESCPACTIEYEELTELVGSLRHARSAVRPLHSFDVTTLPIIKPRRRQRLLLAAAAALGVWTIFCTAALLWPSVGARVAFLRIGRETGPASSVASESGRQVFSLSKVPSAALVEALESLSSGNGLALDSPSNQGLLSRRMDLVHVTRLGPVVEQTTNSLRLRATLDVVKAPGSVVSSQQVQVVIALSRQRDGSWAVTRVVTVTP